VCGEVACCGSGFGICAVHPQKGVNQMEGKDLQLVLNTEVHFVVPAQGHEAIRDPMVCRNV